MDTVVTDSKAQDLGIWIAVAIERDPRVVNQIKLCLSDEQLKRIFGLKAS
jgi:hypothetical protein